jgi:hypothetical protein
VGVHEQVGAGFAGKPIGGAFSGGGDRGFIGRSSCGGFDACGRSSRGLFVGPENVAKKHGGSEQAGGGEDAVKRSVGSILWHENLDTASAGWTGREDGDR